jgi:hypothetical protein
LQPLARRQINGWSEETGIQLRSLCMGYIDELIDEMATCATGGALMWVDGV